MVSRSSMRVLGRIFGRRGRGVRRAIDLQVSPGVLQGSYGPYRQRAF
jgi:hypothetical protein